ncbi:MAG: hypothetical protein WCO16_03415 [bacterium]
MEHLPLDINKFGFVQREICNGLTVKYKCGRDFLYYALHFLLPSKFNSETNNPQEIDRNHFFGLTVPVWLAWTQLQFYKMPTFLKRLSLELKINDVKVTNFLKFFYAMLFSRISYENALEKIEGNVKNGLVSGVDLALRWQGLEDHVLFVYGYDVENLYVFDTNKVPSLEYEKLTDDERYYMKLPKSVVKKRWKTFSRVWEVYKVD